MNPAWAAESDPQDSEEVVRLRAEVVELRAEIQALRAQAQQPVASNVDATRTTPLPSTQLFAPLRADPKEARFFVSALQTDSALRDTTVGAVGFGEHFGLVRRETASGEGWQLGISGAVFAQFDLEAASSDLINADYVIGLPLTWRRGDWSGRLRLYHQSSHLGDEFLLSAQPQRVNLSFEAVEAIVAYDFGNLRLYGGGETLFDRDPAGEGVLQVPFPDRREAGRLILHHGDAGDIGEAGGQVANADRSLNKKQVGDIMRGWAGQGRAGDAEAGPDVGHEGLGADKALVLRHEPRPRQEVERCFRQEADRGDHAVGGQR